MTSSKIIHKGATHNVTTMIATTINTYDLVREALSPPATEDASVLVTLPTISTS